MTEANISTLSGDTNSDLAAAIRARTAARVRVQTAQAALDRARRVARESAAKAERRAIARSAADQAHVSAVENWIAGGCIGDRPERIDDPALASAEAQARTENEVTARALSSLQASQDRAQAEFAETEDRVRAAVAAILLGDATRMAAEIVELERKAVELRLDVIGIIDHPLVRKKHTGVGLPLEIVDGLHPPKPAPNAGYTLPRYAEELLTVDQARVRLARQRWIQRGDELLNEPGEAESSGRHATSA